MRFSRTDLAPLCSPSSRQCNPGRLTEVVFTQKQTLRGRFESKLLIWDMIPGSPSREVKRGGKEGYCWW